MRKNIKKALLFESIVSAKALIALNFFIVIVLSIGAAIIVNGNFMNRLDGYGEMNNLEFEPLYLYFFLFSLFLNALISLAIFGFNKHKKLMFLSNSPFSRKEIITSKAFLAYIINIINSILFLYILILNAIRNKILYDYIETYKTDLITIFLVTLSIAIILCTIYLFVFLSANYTWVVITTVLITMGGIIILPELCRWPGGDIFREGCFIAKGYFEYFISDMSKAIVMVLISIVFAVIVYKFILVRIFNKTKIENIKNLYNNKFLEVIVLIFISLVASNFIMIILDKLEYGATYLISTRCNIIANFEIIVFVFVFGIMYVILNKLLKVLSR